MTSRYAYEKRRRHLAHIGQPLRVPAHGFVRRARALMALGWTQQRIAAELGVDRRNLATMLGSNTSVSRAHHTAMVNLYDRLCMKVPTQDLAARRIRAMAARRCWAVPLAWDNIDNPDETPTGGVHDGALVDEVKVERVLDGHQETCTRAEKLVVLDRWEGSLAELQRVTGWNVHRMINDRKAA